MKVDATKPTSIDYSRLDKYVGLVPVDMMEDIIIKSLEKGLQKSIDQRQIVANKLTLMLKGVDGLLDEIETMKRTLTQHDEAQASITALLKPQPQGE